MDGTQENPLAELAGRLVRLRAAVAELTNEISEQAVLQGRFLTADQPYTNLLSLRELLALVPGDLIWVDTFAGVEALDVVAKAARADRHRSITVLRKGNADDQLRRAARHLRDELSVKAIRFDFVIVPVPAWTAHGRWLINDSDAWTLPSASAPRKADEIRRSAQPAAAISQAKSLLEAGTSLLAHYAASRG